MYPADLADLHRRNPKRQNSLNLKQSVFLCEIMQLAAFVCVICVICGRIFTQEYSTNHQRNHPCDFSFKEVSSPWQSKLPLLTQLSEPFLYSSALSAGEHAVSACKKMVWWIWKSNCTRLHDILMRTAVRIVPYYFSSLKTCIGMYFLLPLYRGTVMKKWNSEKVLKLSNNLHA
jgi:hypothetical protein